MVIATELTNFKLNIATSVAVLNDGNSAAAALKNLDKRSSDNKIADKSLEVV